MIIQDLKEITHNKDSVKLASVSDRLVAFAIDVFIFSPLIQLLLSGMIKKIQLLAVTDPDSAELISFYLVAAALIVLFIILMQSIFLFFFGGTPGKLFLKLRVVSINNSHLRLSVSQCLLRSFFWSFEFALLMVPFLEILSQRHRRSLHDRVAETCVITLKEVSDPGPHVLESHFIRQIIFICFGVFLSWTFFGIGKIYRHANSGLFKKEELLSENILCDDIHGENYGRIDEALALYLTDVVSEECLTAEADFSLWTPNERSKSWGYLAKSFLNPDKKISDKYLIKSCDEDEESEACDISNEILKVSSENFSASHSLTAQILRLQKLEKNGEYKNILNQLKKLDHPKLATYKLKLLMKSFWALNDLEKSRGVFQAGLATLDADSKYDLKSWMCLEELNLRCGSQESAEACRDINNSDKKNNIELAWAQIKSKNCFKSAEPRLSQFSDLMSSQRDFAKLVEATSDESEINLDKRNQMLKELSMKSSGLVQKFALTQWIETERSEKSWQQIFTLLEETEKKDWTWKRNNKRAMQKISELKLSSLKRLPASESKK